MNTFAKKITKKIRAFLVILAGVLALTMVMPAAAYTVRADSGVSAKLNSLRSKFPEGKYWNHKVTTYSSNGDQLFARRDESFANSVTSSQCLTHNGTAPVGTYDCNYFDGGMQCMGFAKKIFYDVFGQRESQLGARYDTGNLMVGDYVRINNNGHSGVVLSISGNTFTLVECNFTGNGGGRCLIRWGYVRYNKSCITYFKHATNYNSVNSVPVTMSWTGAAARVSNTDATISVRANANQSGSFTAASGTLYNSSGKYMASKTENASVNGSYLNVWYNIQSELGKKLTAGTTYYFRFAVTFSGKTYTSPLYRFKTSGTRVIAVSKVTLNKSKISIKRGKTYQLKAGIAPSNATNRNVKWTTSNRKVATVTSKGKVKAVKKGTCWITVTSANGKKAKCKVIVK